MKKVMFLCSLIVATLLLSGCGTTKEVPTSNEVQRILEEYNFSVFETTENVGYAERALYATNAQVKINYVKGNKKYDIQGIFLNECENVYKKTTDYKKRDSGGKNWTNLTVTDKSNYYFVGWIEDSYIVIESPINQEKLMNQLAKDLGFK